MSGDPNDHKVPLYPHEGVCACKDSQRTSCWWADKALQEENAKLKAELVALGKKKIDKSSKTLRRTLQALARDPEIGAAVNGLRDGLGLKPYPCAWPECDCCLPVTGICPLS